jgi:hypothetical protein
MMIRTTIKKSLRLQIDITTEPKKTVMDTTTKKIWRDGFNRLKKTLEKMIRQNKEEAQPQLALQPIRNRPGGLTTPGRETKNN